MEKLVEDLDDVWYMETKYSSTYIDFKDLDTKRSSGTDTARNQARNICNEFLNYTKDTYNSKHVFNCWHEEEAADKSDSIERNLIRVFADCLVKVYKAKSLNCAVTTLSCVKMVCWLH